MPRLLKESCLYQRFQGVEFGVDLKLVIPRAVKSMDEILLSEEDGFNSQNQ